MGPWSKCSIEGSNRRLSGVRGGAVGIYLKLNIDTINRLSQSKVDKRFDSLSLCRRVKLLDISIIHTHVSIQSISLSNIIKLSQTEVIDRFCIPCGGIIIMNMRKYRLIDYELENSQRKTFIQYWLTQGQEGWISSWTRFKSILGYLKILPDAFQKLFEHVLMDQVQS